MHETDGLWGHGTMTEGLWGHGSIQLIYYYSLIQEINDDTRRIFIKNKVQK